MKVFKRISYSFLLIALLVMGGFLRAMDSGARNFLYSGQFGDLEVSFFENQQYFKTFEACLACEPNDVIGSAVCVYEHEDEELGAGEGLIDMLAINKKEHTGYGIGRVLMSLAIDHFQRLEYRKILLDRVPLPFYEECVLTEKQFGELVRKENRVGRLQKFYESLNFALVSPDGDKMQLVLRDSDK